MIKLDDCLLVMGRRGCGKSFLAKNLQKLWPRKIIIDSLNEYKKENEKTIIVNNFNDFSEKLIFLKENKSKEFTLIFQFDPETKVSEELFDQILRVAFYFKNVQIVIEEIQLYSDPHNLPHWLNRCLFIGRHQHLSLLFTTQRPGMLNKSILSQCSHVFIGNLIDGNDIRYVSGFLGDSSKKLTEIPERKFIYFSKDGIKEISNNF